MSPEFFVPKGNRDLDHSIHPRNWSGMNGPVKNTCKPWKGKGKLAKKQERLHKRRLAQAATLKTISAKIPPEAFKQPGSMNEHK